VIAPATGLTDVLRVLVDPTRLRILGLLELDELSVGELARALEMAQSRVSNHLRVLRDAKLLDERHVGRTTYLRLAVGAKTGTPDSDVGARLWQALRPEIPTIPEFASDVARLGRVLQERNVGARDFFDRVAGEWDKIGVEFATGQARHRAAASLLPRELVLADLGCGTGYMARALVGLCRRLVCVDRSQAMLDEAQKKLGHVPAGVSVEFRRGEMDHLPIEDGELDGCVAAMVLHHLPDLRTSLAEMFRTLKPGGRAVVLELAPHKESWMHESLGDRHLGLDSRDVLRAFERAGFVEVALESVEDRYEPRRASSESAEAAAEDPTSASTASLPLYIVRGRRPTRHEDR
jgi:ubiquinone/menaquinone biosynthesis C-methylase UbiE